MKKSLNFLIAGTTLSLFALSLSGASFANEADLTNQTNSSTKLELKEAISSGNFNTFQELVSENEKLTEHFSSITADNFNKLQEAHLLMEEAKQKREEAKAILEELDVKMPRHHKEGKWKKFHKEGGQNERQSLRREAPQIEQPETSSNL